MRQLQLAALCPGNRDLTGQLVGKRLGHVKLDDIGDLLEGDLQIVPLALLHFPVVTVDFIPVDGDGDIVDKVSKIG